MTGNCSGEPGGERTDLPIHDPRQACCSRVAIARGGPFDIQGFVAPPSAKGIAVCAVVTQGTPHLRCRCPRGRSRWNRFMSCRMAPTSTCTATPAHACEQRRFAGARPDCVHCHALPISNGNSAYESYSFASLPISATVRSRLARTAATTDPVRPCTCLSMRRPPGGIYKCFISAALY